MKLGINKKYLCTFIAVFGIEALIAIFIHDRFIRPYIGDVLVVVVIYCFIKAFVRNEIRRLPLYIFIFAALVEASQYFNVVELLGIGDYRIARIIMGSTFDIKDIACYLVGCVGLALLETKKRIG